MPAKATFNDSDIIAELKKLPWYGTDPIRSRDAMDLGRYLDKSKFGNKFDFLDALQAAVDKLEALRNARS